MTADALTVLTCVPGKRCAKAYGPDLTQPPEPYDAGYLFTVDEVPVSSLAELAEALDALRTDATAMVIRDGLRPDARPTAQSERGPLYARRRVDRPGDPAPFEHREHRWACFDADATATAFDPADPTGSVERWRASLPPALRGAAMVFQFSAKAHMSETVRGHAWVWLSEPTGNVPLARWCTRHGLDPALYHAVQPHYTADPTFPAGVADPLTPRSLVTLAGSEAVELDFTPEDLDAALVAPQSGGLRLGALALEEVGDPSDLPEAAAARASIAKQLAPSFERPGKRWDLCGHIGGACYNAGLPAEECCAILEALRAGDVRDHEFGAGLRWALGAYSFTGKPLGIKGIKELTTPVVALKVADGLSTLARALEPVAEETNKPADWSSLGFTMFRADEEPAPLVYVWGPRT